MVMRRDHFPDKLCFNCSGLPIPVKGVSMILSKRALIFCKTGLLPVFFQYAKSSCALTVSYIRIYHQG